MKKFEYAELTQKLVHGNWHWFIGGSKWTYNDEFLTLIEVLNKLGQDGWQVVAYKSSDELILMRELTV